jgi:tetratricopeptide (TPR) repeat protein
VAGFLALRGALLGSWSQISDLPRGWSQKIILTLMALPQYAGKFMVPLGLRASYDVPALTLGRVLTALSGALLLGIYFYRLFQRRAQGGWMFGLWALFALAPMLPLSPIRAFFAERFFYFASLGAAALVGLLIDTYPRLRWPVFLWLVALSTVTCRYAEAWVSDAALWSWTVPREPTNAFAHMCLAETLSNPQAAQAEYFRALVHEPSEGMRLAAWNNLAALALAQRQPKKALYWTAQVLKRRPDAPQALYNRWRALKANGALRQAEALRRILMKDPRFPQRLFR